MSGKSRNEILIIAVAILAVSIATSWHGMRTGASSAKPGEAPVPTEPSPLGHRDDGKDEHEEPVKTAVADISDVGNIGAPQLRELMRAGEYAGSSEQVRTAAAKKLIEAYSNWSGGELAKILEGAFPEGIPNEVVQRLVESWAYAEPEAAARWIGELDSEFYKDPVSAVIGRLSGASLEGFVAALPAEHLAHHVEIATNRLVDSSPQAALNVTLNHAGADRIDELVKSIIGLPGVGGSLFSLMKFEQIPVSESTLSFAALWDRRPTEEVLEQLQSMADDIPVDGAIKGVLQRLGAEDPEAGAKLLAETPDDFPEEAKAAFAQEWAVRDWQAALAWGMQHGDPAIVDQLMQTAAQTTVPTKEFMDEFNVWFQSSTEREVDTIVNGLAQSAIKSGELATVADWADSLPAGAAKDSAQLALASQWVTADPIGASEWLGEIEPSPVRDQAILSLVENLADDPERALEWAKSIGSDELRQQAEESALRAWEQIDPDGLPTE